MSGILLVSPRPKPRRMSASVKDAVPPPPRDLPRINPLIPITLVACTLGMVYFGGLIRVTGEAVQIAAPPKAPSVAPWKAPPLVRRAPDKLPESSRAHEPALLSAVRRLAFLVASQPTTEATFPDRLDTLRSYFILLTPVDRASLFGVAEFAAVEEIFKQSDPKIAHALMDRLFMRLQLTFR